MWPQVQPDIPPEGSPPDSQCWKRRLFAACRGRLATPLLRLRQKVLLSNPSPQPHPDSASQRPILIRDQTVRRRERRGHFILLQGHFYSERPQEVTAKLTSNQSCLAVIGTPGAGSRVLNDPAQRQETLKRKRPAKVLFFNFDVCFFKYLKFLKIFRSNFFIS